MHVASVSGHHKSKDVLLNRNSLLQWYYSIYPLFGYCCVGAELFYVLAYLHFFVPNPTIHAVRCFYLSALLHSSISFVCIFCSSQVWLYGCAPACALKQFVNVVQLWSAMENIALIDAVNKNESKQN